MTDEEPHFDRSLKKLQRSTTAFSWLATIVVTIVFVSSVWTNYKVITLTTGLKHTQAHLAEVQRLDAAHTATARVESCKNSNHDKIAGAHKDIRLSHDFVLAIIRPASDRPAALAAAHTFNVKHDALIRAAYPHRDCSPSGIAEYLGLPQPKGP